MSQQKQKNTGYAEFLERKRIKDEDRGFIFDPSTLCDMLFPFQRDITTWALCRGRAAVFADCGLGKTPIQLEWARAVVERLKKPVLIFAPLAVTEQTRAQGEKFHDTVTICREQRDIQPGINVTNYEMLHKFSSERLGGLVLDESSILKGFDGKFRRAVTEFGARIPFRLCCTATPAPNDMVELVNHAEFLGIMREKEIKALFFTNREQNTVQKWALKKHAERDFWCWLASWAVALRKPSDLGYDDAGFILPPLNITQDHTDFIQGDKVPGTLMAVEARTLRERQKARQRSVSERVKICADLVNNSTEQWLVWCDLNVESAALSSAIPDAVEVKGADKSEHKAKALLDFQAGNARVLVTKPSIAGFGLNLQNCHNMAFVGLSDSYEQLYQATRRCWRFGQTEPVKCHIITSAAEGAVLRNIQRKEKEAAKLFENIVNEMSLEGQMGRKTRVAKPKFRKEVGDGWEIWLGDSVELLDTVEKESIGLSVFSPPFPGMYAYTDSVHDIGNTKTFDELIDQFRFMMPKLLRVTKPGRSCAIHLCQGVAYKGHDGYIGIKDFRGKIIETMIEEGWIYYGEVCIDKNPQTTAIRTHDRGLLFKTMRTDSSMLHSALADYILQFVKPGENEEPIHAGDPRDGWITANEWIEWAAPVWYRASKAYPGGINQTDVLNVRAAKSKGDEKHVCPLQLGVIERCVKLWSAPGDTILSPFMGIGSEGYVSLQLDRHFLGIELKESYFNQAVKNLRTVRNRSKGFNLYGRSGSSKAIGDCGSFEEN